MVYAILAILVLVGSAVGYVIHNNNARHRANRRAELADATAKAAGEVADAERKARSVEEATREKLRRVAGEGRESLLRRLARVGMLRRRNGDTHEG